MKEVRVRFAPSPTGPLHIGGARSALFNWLFARHHGGAMILRIEDTDLDRSSRESETLILESLRWLGIDWDEGVDVGGPHGPYRQQERLHLYQPIVEQLLAAGQAYECFCSEEELAAEREQLLAEGRTPRYLGRCRELSPQERAAQRAAGRKPAIRFRVPAGKLLQVNDLVRGLVEFDSDGIGDFIIVKSDGLPTYNFAVVLDDAAMEISHILRGEEHLSNTPRQLLIYEALGLTPPEFAHISLILGEDRAKMSKRHGATSVVQYREDGYLPQALVNFLALLGWSPVGEEEIFDAAEIARLFSLERVAKSPAVFNLDKLKWMNAYYLKELPVTKLTELCRPHLEEAGLLKTDLSAAELAWLEQIVGTIQGQIEYGAQAPQLLQVFFGADFAFDEEDQVVKEVLNQAATVPLVRAFLDKIRDLPAWDGEEVRQLVKDLGKEQGVKGKALYMAVRVAVSGQAQGPDLNTLLTLLGPDLVARRLAVTLAHLAR